MQELAPATRSAAPPAVFPEGALDAILGLSPWRNWEDEQALIHGAPRTHAATRAYLIEDVRLSSGFLYKKSGIADVGRGDRSLWGPGGVTALLDEAHMVSCYAGSKFFGTFLIDSLPLEMLPPDGSHAIAVPTRAYHHEPGYRALFDLPAPPVVDQARIRRLTFYEDFGQNPGKVARYARLRARLLARLGDTPASPPRGVYLKRGASGERRILANEAALEDRLTRLGFDIVEPERLDADEIARRTLNAPVVVSVEGSHISHVIYTMARDGALIVLQPPDRFAMAYKETTDEIGIRFGFAVGAPAPDGFTVDPDTVDRLIGRMA